MQTLETNKKYKIQKLAEKLELKRVRRIASEQSKYNKLLDVKIRKIQDKYKKRLARRMSKINKQYERKRIDSKKKILGKEVKKILPELSKMKSKALEEIQKYRKLSGAVLTDRGIEIYVYDIKKMVPLDKKVQGGHVYGQRNFAGLAFDPTNIRPITSRTNKQQGDQIGSWIVNLPPQIQYHLRLQSEDKSQKWSLRDHKFYVEIIEKYQKLNEIEEKRLGIYSPKA